MSDPLIGNVVNVASRLEWETRKQHCPILISEEACAALPKSAGLELEFVCNTKLRNIQHAVCICLFIFCLCIYVSILFCVYCYTIIFISSIYHSGYWHVQQMPTYTPKSCRHDYDFATSAESVVAWRRQYETARPPPMRRFLSSAIRFIAFHHIIVIYIYVTSLFLSFNLSIYLSISILYWYVFLVWIVCSWMLQFCWVWGTSETTTSIWERWRTGVCDLQYHILDYDWNVLTCVSADTGSYWWRTTSIVQKIGQSCKHISKTTINFTTSIRSCHPSSVYTILYQKILTSSQSVEWIQLIEGDGYERTQYSWIDCCRAWFISTIISSHSIIW